MLLQSISWACPMERLQTDTICIYTECFRQELLSKASYIDANCICLRLEVSKVEMETEADNKTRHQGGEI